MGKAAMCIQMLELLNTGRVYKVSELANLLETNSRNIIEYRKELEEAGYSILSIPGRYGGYQLDKSRIISALKLSPAEKDALMDAYDYLLKKKDFVKKDNLSRAMGKISSSIQQLDNTADILVVDHYQLTMSESDIRERYAFIEEAIQQKRVVEIEYQSIKSGAKTHQLHPYKLFIYNNTWFFLAWNPEVGDVWYFKLNRIKSYAMLNQTFRVWKYFKAEDYFDGNGFKNHGAFYHVELIVSGVRKHLIKERIYGKNQVIEELPDDKIKVSLDMQNEDSILSFVLGCGLDVEVREPQWLIDRVVDVTQQLTRRYAGEKD